MKKAIFVITFVFALSILAVSASAQKNCSYDSKGPQDVPSAGSQADSVKAGKVSILAGKVTDKSGAVIKSGRASLTRVTKDGNVFIGSQAIDSEGNFCFGGNEGKYILTIGADGFIKSEVRVEVISIEYDAPQKLKVKLQPAK